MLHQQASPAPESFPASGNDGENVYRPNPATYAERTTNSKSVQPSRTLSKLSDAQKASQLLRRKVNQEDHKRLIEDFDTLLQRQTQELEELAEKHNVKREYLEKLRGTSKHYSAKREVNIENAKIHMKAIEVNAGIWFKYATLDYSNSYSQIVNLAIVYTSLRFANWWRMIQLFKILRKSRRRSYERSCSRLGIKRDWVHDRQISRHHRTTAISLDSWMTRWVRHSVLILGINRLLLRSPHSLSARVPLLYAFLQDPTLKIRSNLTGFVHRMLQTLQKIVSVAICGMLQDYSSNGHAPRPKVSTDLEIWFLITFLIST